MIFDRTSIRTLSFLGSCGAFGMACEELAENNSDIIALTADLCSFAGLTRFAEKYPNQYYNIGIAENNMLGIAAGMAKENLIPFATTYATFAAMRSADQVRVNMGYMDLPIKLVGLTSGLSVGILGPTHICIEDIAVMRSIPNITILSPADCMETVKATIASAKINTPVYLRLTGTMGNPPVYKEDYDFEIGKAITLQEGTDIAIIATGTMVSNSLKAAKLIEKEDISVKVVNMHTIKPLDIEAIKQCCNSKLIVTVEEHSIFGGLGSAVSEILAQERTKPQQLIIGIKDKYEKAGDYQFLLEEYGLKPEQIAQKIMEKYKGE